MLNLKDLSNTFYQNYVQVIYLSINHLNSIDIKMLDSLCKALRCTPGDILKYKDVNLSQDETLWVVLQAQNPTAFSCVAVRGEVATGDRRPGNAGRSENSDD